MHIYVLSYEDFEILDPSYTLNGNQWEMANVMVPVVDAIN